MGITKTALFNDTQNELALYAKVIGHPARVAILQHLIQTNQCITGDLVGELGLAQATISQHLKELKALDLIKGTVEGTAVCYCINQAKWLEVRALFLDFFDTFPINNCC